MVCVYTFKNNLTFTNLAESWDYFNLDYSSLEYSSCFLTNVVEQIKPIKKYNNFKGDKDQIKKAAAQQKGKTGVYCLVNLINGHIYIGSSVNLAVRMSNYLNTTYLKNKKNKRDNKIEREAQTSCQGGDRGGGGGVLLRCLRGTSHVAGGLPAPLGKVFSFFFPFFFFFPSPNRGRVLTYSPT